MSGRVLRLRRVSRTVGDLTRMTAFYCGALDFEMVEQGRLEGPGWGKLLRVPGLGAHTARLRLGRQELELVAFDPPGRAYPADRSSADPYFQHLAIVVTDMPAAYARLRRHACEPISRDGPQTLPPNTGSVVAYKFRDPEGHPLELIQFPGGAGAPCWQDAPGLFAGIDHSAIVVTHTEASVAFYARMGWRVAGRSHNRGAEQQRLDGLPDADVDVVSLETGPGGPPHLELLGYRTPSLHAPPASATNARVVDRTVLAVDDLPALLQRLPVECAASGVVDVDGCDRALVCDPDGHRLLLEAGHVSRTG